MKKRNYFSKYFKVWVQMNCCQVSRVVIGKCNTYFEACELLRNWEKENPNVRFHSHGMIAYH